MTIVIPASVPKIYGITHPVTIKPGGGPILEQTFAHYIRLGHGTVTGQAAFEVHNVSYPALKDLEKELAALAHTVGYHVFTFPLWNPQEWHLMEVWYENMMFGPMVYHFRLTG